MKKAATRIALLRKRRCSTPGCRNRAQPHNNKCLGCLAKTAHAVVSVHEKSEKVIAAIDPGAKHTGVILWTGTPPPCACDTLDTGKSLLAIWDWLGRYQPRVCVVESFHLYPHKARTLTGSSFRTVEVIGVVKLWCEFYGERLTMQGASEVKLIKARHLKPLGASPKDTHQRSALKHLAHYLRMHEPAPEL